MSWMWLCPWSCLWMRPQPSWPHAETTNVCCCKLLSLRSCVPQQQLMDTDVGLRAPLRQSAAGVVLLRQSGQTGPQMLSAKSRNPLPKTQLHTVTLLQVPRLTHHRCLVLLATTRPTPAYTLHWDHTTDHHTHRSPTHTLRHKPSAQRTKGPNASSHGCPPPHPRPTGHLHTVRHSLTGSRECGVI